MNARTRVSSAALALALAAAALPLLADEHVVTETSRTYMGQNIPPRAAETWVGKDAALYRMRGVSIIYRFDLKKKITVSDRTKKWFEEPLEPAPAAALPRAVRVQEIGFDRYSPEFDWTVRETAETKTIDGRLCRKVVAEGDADYAEETREMWVAAEVPIDLAAYRKFTEREPDPAWTALTAASPLLRAGFVVEETRVSEHSIAHTMTWLSRTTVMESVAPPPGLYEPPAGFGKAATLEEVYGR